MVIGERSSEVDGIDGEGKMENGRIRELEEAARWFHC